MLKTFTVNDLPTYIHITHKGAENDYTLHIMLLFIQLLWLQTNTPTLHGIESSRCIEILMTIRCKRETKSATLLNANLTASEKAASLS